ncbi:MAG: type IX secretion system membrane protein PorP/SprF [Flavobacteriales bacterium]|nr:type IX secretion system membrane protein PorP/SprF [Flavobacteriales bacterium]
MSTMRPYRCLPILLALLLVGSASAQQDPMYTMYMWNTLSVNPGYAGSADLFTVTGLARQQWVGLDGAPSTQTLTAHTPLRMESLGVGLSVVHDKVGPVNNTLAFADIAYRIRVNERARLAFGLKAGVDLFQVNLGGIQNVDANDPLFGQDLQAKAKPNFGFGMYYWTKKGYIGLSAPKLIEHDRIEVDGATDVVSAIRQQRHYFLIAGYVFDLGRDVKFRPSVLVKAVEGAPIQLDVSAMFLLREKFWLGVAHRSGDSFSALIAYQINDQFKVGYAYDFSTTALRSYHSGSHELMLSYDLRFNKEKTLSPRYF